MNEELLSEIDLLRRTLRMADTQEKAVAWMKKAHDLLGFAANEIERPKIFAVPGSYGVPTFIVSTPKKLILPVSNRKSNYLVEHNVWFEGKTVPYGDKFSNRDLSAWTARDNRRLMEEIKRKKAIA